ncbi:MAG: hypothetical protein KGI50_08150 [Patescibacteria group bacterium]|nr:hypothetical protein [Patescibacteria group bacterium]
MPSETDYSSDAGNFNVISGAPTSIQDYNSNSANIEVGHVTGSPDNKYYGLCQFICNQANSATITTASLTLHAISNDGVAVTLYGVKQGNATWPSSAGAANSLTLTTANVSFTSGIGYNTINVASILQEIVNQGGYASGNYIMFMLKGPTNNWQAWDSYGGNLVVANRPTLVINGGGGGGSGGSGGQRGPNATTLLLQLMGQRFNGF